MKRIIHFPVVLTCAFLLVTILLPSIEAAGHNLITNNAGFDSGNLTGWWDNTSVAVVQSAVRHSGSYAVKLDYAETPGYTSYPLYTQWYVAPQVPTVNVSSAVRVDSVTGGSNLTVSLFWERETNYDNFEQVVIVENAAHGWRVDSAVVNVPVHTKRFSFLYRVNGNGKGSRIVAYVDSASVTIGGMTSYLPFMVRP